MNEDKKIEIEVPVGYKLVQDGMKFEFVKIDEPLTGWRRIFPARLHHHLPFFQTPLHMFLFALKLL
jgi:hypothetical protein